MTPFGSAQLSVVPDQAVVEAILGELGQVPKSLVAEMEADLGKLINRHSFIQVSCSHPQGYFIANNPAVKDCRAASTDTQCHYS